MLDEYFAPRASIEIRRQMPNLSCDSNCDVSRQNQLSFKRPSRCPRAVLLLPTEIERSFRQQVF
jgi:hypothetical protein